jgi:uncharacterized membrane protein YdbT with pleckstrin-like domain
VTQSSQKSVERLIVERERHLTTDQGSFDIRKIRRPDPVLLTYYFITSLFMGPFFIVPLLPLFFKYHTLKYSFDESGISMSWGILFRREIYLTYRRIQDIHLSRNIIQRWLGLATVAIQTASGSAKPEMSIEGIMAADELRDHLYSRMRGAVRGPEDTVTETIEKRTGSDHQGVDEDQVLSILVEIRDHLQKMAADKPDPDEGVRS